MKFKHGDIVSIDNNLWEMDEANKTMYVVDNDGEELTHTHIAWPITPEDLEKAILVINPTNYGSKEFKISLGTGTAWLKEFIVYADYEQEAIDIIADYIEEEELCGLFWDHYELADLCEIGITVDEYAEANNLICCGNHGIYINVMAIDEVIKEEM